MITTCGGLNLGKKAWHIMTHGIVYLEVRAATRYDNGQRHDGWIVSVTGDGPKDLLFRATQALAFSDGEAWVRAYYPEHVHHSLAEVTPHMCEACIRENNLSPSNCCRRY